MSSYFQSSLKAGQIGEAAFHELYPDWERLEGTSADFKMPDGRLVELKTELRSTADTPNMAIELNSSAGKPGALEKSVTDGCSFIVYYYSDGAYFAFDPKELLEYVTKYRMLYRKVSVPNANYDTTVLLLPRRDIEHLLKELK